MEEEQTGHKTSNLITLEKLQSTQGNEMMDEFDQSQLLNESVIKEERMKDHKQTWDSFVFLNNEQDNLSMSNMSRLDTDRDLNMNKKRDLNLL